MDVRAIILQAPRPAGSAVDRRTFEIGRARRAHRSRTRYVRILYYADIRFPLERANGIQTMETCYALAARGHDVELLVRPDTQPTARDPFAYYGLTPIDTLAIRRSPARLTETARRFEYLRMAGAQTVGRGAADAVMTRDLGVASLLLRIPRRLRPPVVYESHGYAPEVARSLPDLVATATAPTARKLARLAAREARVWGLADGYVTITAALAADLSGRLGARPGLAVVPDGVRLEQGGVDRAAVPALDGVDPRLTVAYAGHLYAWKGVDVLLEALARVPGAHGLVVGGHRREPDLARLQDLAQRLGLAARTTFTGLVEPRTVPELLGRAAVLVLPNTTSTISARYTSPLKLFEYMAARRPIVASDLPAIREVLCDDVNALLVPPGDAAALAGAIGRLLGDPALASRLARAAHEAVPQYSWDRRAARLEALFTEVTASAGASA
jgi:glycosyltransferase involved in cell wall biosynthesis